MFVPRASGVAQEVLVDAMSDVPMVGVPALDVRPASDLYFQLRPPSEFRSVLALDESVEFWIPSLAHLAVELPNAPGEDRSYLESFLVNRENCSYVTVDELIEGTADLVALPWPIVVDGALVVPTSQDSIHVAVEVDVFQEFIDAHRTMWAERGVIDDALATRAVRLGDAFAIVIVPADESIPPGLATESGSFGEEWPVLHVGVGRGVVQLGGAVGDDGQVVAPVVDVSWDAREQGKLAGAAAMAGVQAANAPGVVEIIEMLEGDRLARLRPDLALEDG